MNKVLWLKTSSIDMPQFEELAEISYNLQLVKHKSVTDAKNDLNAHGSEFVAILLEDDNVNRSIYFNEYELPIFLLTTDPSRDKCNSGYETFVCGEEDDDLLKAVTEGTKYDDSGKKHTDLKKAMEKLKVPVSMQKQFIKTLATLDEGNDPGDIYNQFRILVEYIFRGLAFHEIIPYSLINSNHGNINMADCCKYLAGKNAEIVGVRYGKKGDFIVKKSTMSMLESVINMGNYFSHSSADGHYETEETIGSKQLCAHILVWLFNWFREFVTKNKDVDFLSKCIPIDKKQFNEGRNYYNEGFSQACDDIHNDILYNEYLNGFDDGYQQCLIKYGIRDTNAENDPYADSVY